MKKSDHKKKLHDKKRAAARKKHQSSVAAALERRQERVKFLSARKVKVVNALQENLRELEAMDAENEATEINRVALNQELEAKGLKTLEEKMEYLEKNKGQMGGSADCSFSAN